MHASAAAESIQFFRVKRVDVLAGFHAALIIAIVVRRGGGQRVLFIAPGASA